jgi:hypothetical protein
MFDMPLIRFSSSTLQRKKEKEKKNEKEKKRKRKGGEMMFDRPLV